MGARPPAAQFSVDLPKDLLAAITGTGTIAPPISRNEAMQVTAVMRARNLIAGSIAKLPLCVQDQNYNEIPPYSTENTRGVTYLVNSAPDPEVAQVVTMAMTVEDMMFYGVAWWQVTRFGFHGYPVEARWVPHSSVLVAPTHVVLPSRLVISPDELFPTPGDGGVVYIDGRPVPDNQIIRFDSPQPPLLRHAARAIRTCLLLDQSAALYAGRTIPLGYFGPEDPTDPPDDADAQQSVDDLWAAMQRNAMPYIPGGIKPYPLQWNPEQLQLAAQRQNAILEIARATGVDADYLESSGQAGNSETYANSEDKRQDLIDFTCDPYLTAIEQRLSMRDLLPRGYNARFDITAFVRGDTASRMNTYKTGLEVGAYTKPEIRRLERKRPLTAAELADSAPVSPTKPVPAQDVPVTDPAAQPGDTSQGAPQMSRFSADTNPTRVTFVGDDVAATFRVNTERRTVSGMAVPWMKVAWSGGAKWKFLPSSLHWSSDPRVKMNVDHDHLQTVGVGVRLQSTPPGLDTTFRVARGAEGDRALALAEDGVYDGFSVEIEFDGPGDGYSPDPEDRSVNLVHSATLRAVALTAMPAFDDARLTSVAASRPNPGRGDETMGAETATTTPGQPPETFNFESHLAAAVDRMADAHKQLSTQLAESLGESFSAAMRVALEDLPNPQNPGSGTGPQPVRAARYTITREAPVYTMDGAGHSLVRDGWYSVKHRDHDATERLRRFGLQTEELAKFSRAVMSFAGGSRANFASTTSNASQIIPPGYRPDLFVPMLAQGRPLVQAITPGTIDNATPFIVPIFGSMSGATGTHVEGSNPSDGSLTFTTKTVTPTTVDGKLTLTRELVDSSNPAIDQIALQAMRESYARQTEAAVYTLLNGANGAGGTITAGFVPSGSQAATFASTGGTPFPEAALIKGIRQQLAAYPFARFASPEIGLMGQNATKIIAGTSDSTGRPLFPSINPYNAFGQGNTRTQGWEIDTVPFIPAWAMTGVAAGDSQIMVLNSLDAWAWESPTLLFQFFEKQGPANIEMALFGYFATHLLRPVGLSGIRIT